MALSEPLPSLDEILESIGVGGQRLATLDATEGAAGNISVCVGWPVEVRRHFPIAETIELPVPAPHLAGHRVVVTGSGRRLRDLGRRPLANLGVVVIDPGGTQGVLHTAHERLFTTLTSEWNSHLAVHQDQVARRGIDFQAVVHAQPPHLTYLSHIPAYRDTKAMNAAILRWEPESIVSLSQGIEVLEFMIPGSDELQAAKDEPDLTKQIPAKGTFDSTGIHLEGGLAFRPERRVAGFHATFPETGRSGMAIISAEEAVYFPPGEPVPGRPDLSGGWVLYQTFPEDLPGGPPEALTPLGPRRYFLKVRDADFDRQYAKIAP